MWLAWALIYTLALTVITALAANARGRDPGLWALLGFLFGIFALIAVLVIGRPADELDFESDSERSSPPCANTDETKQCPDCAEMIKTQARVCRFCGKRFEDLPTTETSKPDSNSATTASADSSGFYRCPKCRYPNSADESYCQSCGAIL